MNLIYPVHGLTGAFHLIVALLAILFGTYILFSTKGTQRHKRVGYLYAVSMLLLNITAFMLFNLTGKFNVFHIAAIVSSLTLFAGIIPVIIKKPAGSYVHYHFSFMYWSVMGLYAAFVSETLVRIPATPFWGAVGVGTALVMLAGGLVFGFKKAKWEALSSL